MSYVGNIPAEKYSSLTQQTFSSPTGTNFVLSQSVTNSADIALFVDNVRQDPTTYTAVGTALTTSTISSPSTMYCLYNGRTTETISPASGSVDSSHLVAGSVDDSHISGLAASKLTGALPAISGASLTGLPSDVTSASSAPGSPTAGNLWWDTANLLLKVYSGTSWNVVSNNFIATGGTITTVGGYKIHTFTSSGTLTVTNGTGSVDYLVVAGGGGGAGASHGGAGGAGGLLTGTGVSLSAGSFSITVGAGGASSPTIGVVGENSIFSTFTALGGGYGGKSSAGGAGGSGGGGGWNGVGGAGTVGQGYAGGTASASGSNYGTGGGGGAGAVGGNGTSTTAGNGGVGLSNSYSGSAVMYAGGGGGGTYNGGTVGVGGLGGGGAGSTTSVPTAGTANTGGGAGGYGGSAAGAGAAGGSGIVIIRYAV